uniref:Uncharacterized protein n=1 Tax=Panagrellus redivivus TaxID=6233 RepID=A0A7E4VSB4_PANRE
MLFLQHGKKGLCTQSKFNDVQFFIIKEKTSTDHLLSITDRDNSIEPSLRPDPINRFDSKHRPHPATTPPSTPTMPRGPAVSPPMASSIKKAQAASQTRTFRGERTLSLVVRLSFALSRVVTIA